MKKSVIICDYSGVQLEVENAFHREFTAPDGTLVEIDLADDHAVTLDQALEAWDTAKWILTDFAGRGRVVPRYFDEDIAPTHAVNPEPATVAVDPPPAWKPKRVRKAAPKKTAAVKASAPKAADTNGKTDPAKIRAWAKATGQNLGDRGRIPASMVKAYEAAMVDG